MVNAGAKVQAMGIFAKGLHDGRIYTLQPAATYNGQATYNFIASNGKVVARFTKDQVTRFLRSGMAGDNNGLVYLEVRNGKDG